MYVFSRNFRNRWSLNMGIAIAWYGRSFNFFMIMIVTFDVTSRPRTQSAATNLVSMGPSAKARARRRLSSPLSATLTMTKSQTKTQTQTRS